MLRKHVAIWAVALCVGLLWYIAPTPASAAVIEAWTDQNQGLTHVHIPDDVTEIRMGAYADNELRSVVIPPSVEFIREWAFERNQFRLVVIEGAGTVIDSNAFAHNSGAIIVVGHSGSSAQSFAAARGYRFVPLELYRHSLGLHYVIENATAELYFYDGTNTDVAIPAEIDGYPVTAIRDEAFKDSELTSVVLPEGLLTIGNSAFMNNALSNVTIPDSVTAIGEWAFQHNRLSAIQWGSGLTAIGTGVFANNRLVFLEVPEHIQHIGDWAFENTLIMELRLSDGLETVGRGAFSNIQIRKLRLPVSVKLVEALAFANNPLQTVIVESNDITFQDNPFIHYPEQTPDIIVISNPNSTAQAFADARGLDTAELLRSGDYYYYEAAENKAVIADYIGEAGGALTIPGELGGSVVQAIGPTAFSFRSLSSVGLPQSLHEIGDGAFQYNPISGLNIGDELKTIGFYAFLSTALDTVRLPESVEHVDHSAFLFNPLRLVIAGAATVFESDALKVLGDSGALTIVAPAQSHAEDYAVLHGNTFRASQSDGTFDYYEHEPGAATIYAYAGAGGAVHIPDTFNDLNVTIIERYAFALKGITSITLPARLTVIGEGAFRYNHLSEVTIGPEVRVIAKEAFLNNALTRVRIPNSVQEVGIWAFLFNPLQQVVFERIDTSIGNSAFLIGGDHEAAARIMLVGYTGTTAETYALANGHSFYDIETTPGVTFSPDGMAWSRLADGRAAVDVAHGILMHYMWSTDEAPQAWGTGEGWTRFTSGDEVSLPVDSGAWFLHLHVTDVLERAFFLRSQPYRVDHDAPVVQLEAAILTPTNQPVTVTASVYDGHSGIAMKKWIFGEAGKEIILSEGEELGASFVAEHNGVYSVYAQDVAGNETMALIPISNIDREKPVVTLTGSPVMTIPLGAPFIDPGSTATDNSDGDLTGFVTVTGSVNPFEVGAYTLHYLVTDRVGNTSDPVLRFVYVVQPDEALAIFPSLSPSGQTNGPVTVTASVYAANGLDVMKYVLEDAELADFAKGGMLWDGSPITLNDNGRISLYVKDQAGLEVIKMVEIANIDRVKPVITLNGSATILIEQGEGYSDPGVTAIDDVDGEITNLVTVSGSVNTSAAGTYTLQYDVADQAGNAADPVSRTVQVTAVSDPQEPTDPQEQSGSESPSLDDQRTGTITQQGGVFEVLGVIFQIPELAVEQPVVIRVEVVHDEQLPSLGRIYSEVYDITKDVPGAFAKRIRVALPFEVKQEELYAGGLRLTLAWLDERAGAWIELEQVEVDWEARTVSGETNHFTKFAVIAVASEVVGAVEIDPEVPADIAGHWAMPHILHLIQSGLASGYPDGLYKPDQPITRAEFIALVSRVLQLEPSGTQRFADTAGHWAEGAISAAAGREWVSGYEDGTFRPNALITREEMAAIIVRSFGLTAGTAERSYADDAAISGWAKEAVRAAAENGIIVGDHNGRFRPKASATRAEVATVIAKWLNRIDDEGRLTR